MNGLGVQMSSQQAISFAIDSATLTILASDVEFPDQWFTKEVGEIAPETGEIRDVGAKNVLSKYDRGIPTKYQYLPNQHVTGHRAPKDVVRITINAKQLERLYFDGINIRNVGRVYDYIISQGVVNMSLDAFLSGWLTDCDVKIDFKLDSLDEVKANIDALINRTRPTLKSKGKSVFHPFQKSDNYGAEWYKRKDTKGYIAPSKQPSRAYAKYPELVSNSREFYNAFFAGNTDMMGVLRIETVGIRNKKSAELHYGIEDNSLLTVLNVIKNDPDTILNMFYKSFGAFLMDYAPKKKDKTITDKELALGYALDMLIEETGGDLDELVDAFTQMRENDKGYFAHRSGRSRLKREIKNCYFNLKNEESDPSVEAGFSPQIINFIQPAFGLS